MQLTEKQIEAIQKWMKQRGDYRDLPMETIHEEILLDDNIKKQTRAAAEAAYDLLDAFNPYGS